jgi:hypothetical protein
MDQSSLARAVERERDKKLKEATGEKVMQTLTGQPAQAVTESFPQPGHLAELVFGFRHVELE